MVNRARQLIRSHPFSNSALLSLILGTGLLGLPLPLPVQAQPTEPLVTLQRRNTQFTDLTTNHPASIYITKLAEAGIIKGFPDRSFRPEEAVTRAQFAAILRQAFPNRNPVSNSVSNSGNGNSGNGNSGNGNPVIPFTDVPNTHWALEAIQIARVSGFLAGYPDNRFRPEQNIPRVQALVALNNGLDYVARPTTPDVLTHYQDANEIPDYAIASLQSATQAGLVVSYPSLTRLRPNRNATRAEVAAFVYQAMAKEGKIAALADAPYAVKPSFSSWPTQPNGVIPVVGQVQLSSGGDRLLITNAEGFQVWNSRTLEPVSAVPWQSRRRTGPGFRATDIAINAAGTRVAAVTQAAISGQLILELWDANTGQLLWQVPVSDVPNQPRANQGFSSARTVTFRSGDDAILLYLYREGGTRLEAISLQLHDVRTGSGILYFEERPGIFPRAVAFNPQGTALVSYRQQEQGGGFNSQVLDIWPLASTGAFVPGRLGQSIVLSKSPLGFVDMAFTARGSLRVLSQHLYDIRLDTWSLAEGQRIESVRSIGDVDRTDTLGVLSPDGAYYFVRSDVAGTRLINTKTYRSTPLANIARDAAFDARGETLAIATPTQVEIFRQVTAPSP